MSEMGTVVAALAALSMVVEQISLTNYYGGHGRVAMASLQRAVGSNDRGCKWGAIPLAWSQDFVRERIL
jgi:hypothetical protein